MARVPGRIEIAQLTAALAEARRTLRASERARRALERRVAVLEALLASAQAALVKAQQTIREYQHQLFGQHSERGAVPGSAAADVQNSAEDAATGGTAVEPRPEPAPPALKKKKKRGAPLGHPGYGRRVVEELPCTEHVLSLPEEQRRCPCCGELYVEMPGAYAVSLLLDWAVSVFYRRYLRQKYRRVCSCPGTKRILVAPSAAKVVRKGLLSPQFIARICVEKFWLNNPLHRTLRGLWLNTPTPAVTRGGITRALKRLLLLLRPLYAAICDRVRQSALVGADETTASVHCTEDDPERAPDHKPSWWTWCFRCADAVAFVLRQHRDHEVPFAFFGWDPKQGKPAQPLLLLISDCYVVYKALAGWVVNAYCWAHLRRRFIKAARDEATPGLARWAENWRQRIRQLYDLTAARRQALPAAWATADQALRAHVAAMHATAKRQLADSALDPAQRGVLESLNTHWAGLTLFLDHPEVPLDNNELERILRGPVVGRKNFLFFGSIWSARLAEMLWSILATAARNGLNPLTYLTAYLQACADNGGRPPEGPALQRFLPWAVSVEDRARWAAAPPSILQLPFAPRTPAPRLRRRASHRPVATPVPAGVDSS